MKYIAIELHLAKREWPLYVTSIMTDGMAGCDKSSLTGSVVLVLLGFYPLFKNVHAPFTF